MNARLTLLALSASFLVMATASPVYDPDEDLFAGYGFKHPYPMAHNTVADVSSLSTLAKMLLALTAKDSKAVVAEKRGSFWRPMGGPLPVQTRFVSFGSRLEPDHTKDDGPAGIKAMRYGRR
ncbi:hypothetical protein CAPTEDRAFT_216446 [Capitella teleta]|uniref:Uncharacterized protein n=1 Tax=Capitella teleta TaxID=283909 RepID=R7TDX5_CAPTE|nr:hypothetical protein CAPTEDRAFT_216446 [Capitella teleta]|eukprot:ELT91919.1 hypothetical protein CAPTEDRAFT_216446 [Capitella teleta]